MDQVPSRRFFFMPCTCGASWSRLPPRTSGTQIFSTMFSSVAPVPVVGRVGAAGSAAAGGVAGAAAPGDGGAVVPGAAGVVVAGGAVVDGAAGAGGVAGG